MSEQLEWGGTTLMAWSPNGRLSGYRGNLIFTPWHKYEVLVVRHTDVWKATIGVVVGACATPGEAGALKALDDALVALEAHKRRDIEAKVKEFRERMLRVKRLLRARLSGGIPT